MSQHLTSTQQQVPPAVLELGERAWRERMREPYAVTAELRAAAVLAAYRAGLAAASPLNAGGANVCWALRQRATGDLKVVAHGQHGGVDLLKLRAQLENPAGFELMRWNGAAWVVVRDGR